MSVVKMTAEPYEFEFDPHTTALLVIDMQRDFGLIHGAQLGWGVSPLVALGYAMFGATCLALGTREPNAAVST